jgi:hypothetical protein
MKLTNITEGLSKVLYHYTNLRSAVDILESGEFKLTSALGSIEASYTSTKYNYFLSTSRTKFGGYHHRVGSSAVMFNLDGQFYNNITKGGPVDYWQERGHRDDYKQRPSEAEDRILSRTPSLPVGGVTSVHVYSAPMSDNDRQNYGKFLPSLARKVLMLAKLRKIPVYFYEDETIWRQQTLAGRVQIRDRETLQGAEASRHSGTFLKRYLMPWLELIYKTNPAQLSKEAKSIQHSLAYHYNQVGAAKGLATDFNNFRRAANGQNYKDVLTIVAFIQKNKLNSLGEFVESMKDKWTT